MFTVTTVSEAKRGCGYRGAGGTYIVGGELNAPCGKLPKVLDVCPTCHAGWKPTRSWTWINLAPLFPDNVCGNGPVGCLGCPLRDIAQTEEDKFHGHYRAGLIWIGEKFYPTPADFLSEAARMGISRRLPNIPNGFVAGETLVLFAHRKAIHHPAISGNPEGYAEMAEVPEFWERAIVAAFIPRAVQYVVKDSDDAAKLEKLAKKGVELVRVKHTVDEAQHGKVLQTEQFGDIHADVEAALL